MGDSGLQATSSAIIEGGQADRYHHAVRWLEQAGRAAKATGKLDKWRDYVEDVRRRHSRKYKLAPMLDELLGKWR